jgi:hypothetical protein
MHSMRDNATAEMLCKQQVAIRSLEDSLLRLLECVALSGVRVLTADQACL